MRSLHCDLTPVNRPCVSDWGAIVAVFVARRSAACLWLRHLAAVALGFNETL